MEQCHLTSTEGRGRSENLTIPGIDKQDDGMMLSRDVFVVIVAYTFW